MEFDKEQIHQLRMMFEEQRSMISLDTHSIVTEELAPMQDQLEQLRSEIASDTRGIVSEAEERLSRDIQAISKMESGDIQVAYEDIVVLKKRVKNDDARISVLER